MDKKLKDEGKNRLEMGREAFIDACWDWTHEYGGIIQQQIRRMGCSIDFEDERFTMDPDYAEAVRRVICEDGYLGIGKEVQQFEADVAAYLGVPASWVISVNTGTAALHLAVEAVLGHGSGAEVLVPSLTFVASFQAISGAGAVPVACDARLDTATIDLADAEKRLTPCTKAIMPVHYASNPVNLDGVYAFAEKHGLRVIEDAAHAFGCLYKGRKIGSFGDVACFSFDGIKKAFFRAAQLGVRRGAAGLALPHEQHHGGHRSGAVGPAGRRIRPQAP